MTRCSRVISRSATIALVSAAAMGCATEPKLPTYPPMDAAASLAVMAERSAKSHGATGKGTVTLSSTTRGGVLLDAVFVLRPPDAARVRAWKFGQAVFDLTLMRDGTWLYVPREPGGSGNITTASRDAGGAIRQWLTYLEGTPPSDPGEATMTDRTIVTRHPTASGTLITTIDRPTLTARSYRFIDETKATRFELRLGSYREFGTSLWPTRIEAQSATGTITIQTRELQPDVVAPAAFTPPARAVRVP